MPISARHINRPKAIILGAFLWLIQLLLIVAALAALGLMFWVDKGYGIWFIGGAAGVGLLWLVRFIHARSVTCQLCHGKILHGSQCHKHSESRRHGMFSYTSSLYIDVVSGGKFTCMYCGTPFRLKK